MGKFSHFWFKYIATLENSTRGICILGSTGSIGTQALEVIDAHPDKFHVEVLTCNSSTDLLIKQSLHFKPNAVVVCDEHKAQEVKEALEPHYIKVYTGHDAAAQATQMEGVDMVLAAMVGFAGLKPVLSAIDAGKTIALANKETLVVAGELVTQRAKEKGVNILPVDSEHSAIFQCLTGEFHNPIRRLILTASGGPFRGKKRKELLTIKPEKALKHPNWDMGAKVSIDSATLMNKGLEVIEAKWLFAVAPEKIEVIVHAQSIFHSFVEFADGSIKGQMGLPDMRLPIQYALGYPERLVSTWEKYDFTAYPSLTFEKPDIETFRCLQLAVDAMKTGGTAPCILNAANEVAVEAFLQERIGFLQIAELVEECLLQQSITHNPSLEQYFQADEQTRKLANDLCSSTARRS